MQLLPSRSSRSENYFSSSAEFSPSGQATREAQSSQIHLCPWSQSYSIGAWSGSNPSVAWGVCGHIKELVVRWSRHANEMEPQHLDKREQIFKSLVLDQRRKYSPSLFPWWLTHSLLSTRIPNWKPFSETEAAPAFAREALLLTPPPTLLFR